MQRWTKVNYRIRRRDRPPFANYQLETQQTMMRNTSVFLAATLIALSFGMPASAATRVFLLAGQSNMAGLGAYSGYLGASAPETQYPYNVADKACPAPYTTPQTGVYFWNYSYDSISGSIHNPGTGNGWINNQFGYGYRTDQFGPELSFGYRMKELYPNDQIYLIKYGISGTTLAEDWNPNGSGACYNTFKARVNAAMSNLTTTGKNPIIAGMAWMQGESDAIESHTFSLNYASNLANFIGKVRTYVNTSFGTTKLPIALGRITTYYGPATDNAIVRAAQDDIVNHAEDVSVFNTDDLEWAYRGHYGTQGQIDLGIRFANEFAPTPTPEPSTLAMIGMGAISLLGYAWRKRK